MIHLFFYFYFIIYGWVEFLDWLEFLITLNIVFHISSLDMHEKQIS